MATTVIELPHTLGRDEARRRIKARIGELPAHIPGGAAVVHSSWPGEHRMLLDIAAMGQSGSATVDVEDRLVRVSLVLPPLLGFMSGAIATAVRARGSKLLLGGDG